MEFDAVLLERVNLFHAASCYVDLHGGVGCGAEGTVQVTEKPLFLTRLDDTIHSTFTHILK